MLEQKPGTSTHSMGAQKQADTPKKLKIAGVQAPKPHGASMHPTASNVEEDHNHFKDDLDKTEVSFEGTQWLIVARKKQKILKTKRAPKHQNPKKQPHPQTKPAAGRDPRHSRQKQQPSHETNPHQT